MRSVEVDLISTKPYKVFHTSCDFLRKQVHVVLVRPEYPGNVGSIARAMSNMGVKGSLRIVGNAEIGRQSDCVRMAKHAYPIIEGALHFKTLDEAIPERAATKCLAIAATARVGSASRPHPMQVHQAIPRGMEKLKSGEVGQLFLVFGPESDGLNNSEIDLCDWIATIPSADEYRSLNLAQSVLVFCYEVNQLLVSDWAEYISPHRSQKVRLIEHILKMAEEVGFILPGDPMKMRPRLEEILSVLPSHLRDVKTLHGLMDQVIRTVRRGAPDVKGRYKKFFEFKAEES